MSFFFWPLCCLFFFHIRILITPLVSSKSSCNYWLCSISSYISKYVDISKLDVIFQFHIFIYKTPEFVFTALIFQYARLVNTKLFFIDLHCKSKIVDSNFLICYPAISACFVFMFLFSLLLSALFSEGVDFTSLKQIPIPSTLDSKFL